MTAVTKQEVVRLLDSIPTFNIVNDGNCIVGTKDEHGEECVRFWLDAEEAASALVPAQLAAGDAMPLRLAVTPLGTAFALTHKWQDCPSALPLRLHAARSVVAGLADDLGATADAADIVPIFCCDELSSSRVRPFFLSRQDLADTWVAAGRPATALPTELTVTSLPALVKLMLSGSSASAGEGETVNWRTAMFIASNKASTRAQAIEEADAEARRKREEKESDPPPLQ